MVILTQVSFQHAEDFFQNLSEIFARAFSKFTNPVAGREVKRISD
jgi:hypothetical protein